MTLLGSALVIDGARIDANVAGSITAATLRRRIDGATRLDLTIFDPRMDLLRSGALTRPGKPSKGREQFQEAAWDRFSAARLNLDGIAFKLAGGTFQYDAQTRETTVSFEDELAVLMRLQEKAIKVSRGQDTRAEFMRTLVRMTLQRADVPFTRAIGDRYYSPQAGQREAIAEPKDDDARQKGFAKGKKLKIKTATWDSEQRDVLTVALTEADRLRAGERASVALVDALITESECRNLPGGDADSSGALQVQQRTAATIVPNTITDPRVQHGLGDTGTPRPVPRGALNPRDVKEVVRIFLLKGYAAYSKGAIKYAAENPDAEIYEIAQAMQGSGAGRASNGQANYGPWVEQAKTILEAWGGAGATHTIREAFEFRAGGRVNGSAQNYWNDSGDSAEVVRWRRFADRNRVWFVPDEWLFERKPTIHISGADGLDGLAAQGIIGLETTGFDIGLPLAEIIVRCFLPRWGGAPGATVEIEDLGALDGRWLIASNDMDLLPPQEIATITLQRPQPKKKEPAPKTNTITLTETRPEAGTVRAEIVAVAEKAFRRRAYYRYGGDRPMGDTLFPAGGVDDAGKSFVQQVSSMDCSAFVTLAYKAAGAPDPNGSGYNGQGNTATLRANGRKTSDPKPGDLAHYGSGAAGPSSHVGIYVGAGKVIEMGGTPGPLKLDVKYRPDFAGYWTHDLGPGE